LAAWNIPWSSGEKKLRDTRAMERVFRAASGNPRPHNQQRLSSRIVWLFGYFIFLPQNEKKQKLCFEQLLRILSGY
jgi:hypothetical protein